jgi:hypothetical protein
VKKIRWDLTKRPYYITILVSAGRPQLSVVSFFVTYLRIFSGLAGGNRAGDFTRGSSEKPHERLKAIVRETSLESRNDKRGSSKKYREQLNVIVREILLEFRKLKFTIARPGRNIAKIQRSVLPEYPSNAGVPPISPQAQWALQYPPRREDSPNLYY